MLAGTLCRGMNMFRSVGDNTMRGDYALEAKNDQGKKSYALMNNALDTNGKMKMLIIYQKWCILLKYK